MFKFYPVADSVYLADDELLQEYILNENGILYQGSWDQITTLPWNFGQVTTSSTISLLSSLTVGDFSFHEQILKCIYLRFIIFI